MIMKKNIKIIDPVKQQRVKKEKDEKREKQKQMEMAKLGPLKVGSTTTSKKKIRPRDIVYPNPYEALKTLKLEEELKSKGKDQTIDFVIRLDTKGARRGIGGVRGLVTFPGGAIKAPKLCVFTSREFQDKALEWGADMVGDANMVKTIIDSKEIPFEKCLATNDVFNMLKGAARVLGPKGLMPNVKSGNLIEAKVLEETIREIKAGKREFRINPDNFIRLPIGKRSFSDDNLMKNVDSVINSIWEAKPEGVKNYLTMAFFFPTRGRVYRIDVNTMNPYNDQYFYDDYQHMRKEQKKGESVVDNQSDLKGKSKETSGVGESKGEERGKSSVEDMTGIADDTLNKL